MIAQSLTTFSICGERKFTRLRDFAAGLATVSPSAANVESYFSIMKWEKNKFRSALTYFSLGGAFCTTSNAKQH
jgi:hypothetical protein